MHPMQGLDNPHGGAIGPVEAARRCVLEVDLLIAELDRLQARIDEHFDARRNGRGEARSLAAVMPSTTARAWSRRVTARMTAR